ncbi:hypothetical protein ACW5F0_13780 [Luteimonas sp. A534]
MNTNLQRAIVLSLLVLLMAATRSHVFTHFTPVPDATWAAFFIGGFYLRAWARWAFPALMALAVVIDYIVISGQGLNFFAHYCVSPGYWMLVPAHAGMWAGGHWLRSRHDGADFRALARLAGVLVLATAACHLFAQGGFYWLSPAVAEPTFAGWAANYGHWFAPYLGATAMFVAAAALAQVVSESVARNAGPARQRGKR